jgi:hypothetical protein
MSQLPEWLGSNLGPCVILALAAAASVGWNTDVFSPPRFDGAGYAVLGEALATGRGYREIDRPDAPRHDHFPPGYPAALALLWRTCGHSNAAAHVFSAACTVVAVLLAWRWFRTLYPPRPAFLLSLALAMNWTWGRVGGAIQSEPLYFVWEMAAVLALTRAGAGRRGGVVDGIVLGILLAACVLTRQVGVGLVVASTIELGWRRRWRTLGSAIVTVLVLVLPWIVWLASVGRNPQAGLLIEAQAHGAGAARLAARITGQGIFYVRRFPDQVLGPFVEVATVFGRSRAVAIAADIWAVLATAGLIWGWSRGVRSPRRRLAGLIAFTTLALLLVWPFTEAGRFLIPLLPFVLAGATEALASLVPRRAPGRPRDWAVAIVLAATLPYPAYAIASGRAAAQRRTQADFDAACRWIARDATQPGPVLTRHPGEVFWQTGRQAVPPDAPEPEAIDRLIGRFGVAYLLIDDARYANAEPNPLARYVERFPRRVTLVRDGPSVRIFAVIRSE